MEFLMASLREIFGIVKREHPEQCILEDHIGILRLEGYIKHPRLDPVAFHFRDNLCAVVKGKKCKVLIAVKSFIEINSSAYSMVNAIENPRHADQDSRL